MTKKAIIHVENTDNLIEFAQYLVSSGWTILSANKTYDFLEKENIPVVKEPALVENNQYTLETCKLVQDILDTKLSEEDSFEFFPIAAAGSCAEKAELVVEPIKARFKCLDCGYEGDADRKNACCFKCGSTAIRIFTSAIYNYLLMR